MIDSIAAIREDFPILGRRFNGKQLVYLDNAATTQKPRSVVQALADYYLTSNANVGRSVFSLSLEATAAYDLARDVVRRYLNAARTTEIVFTRGTTESINLVANSLGDLLVGEGDEVLLTALEHHANLCPWQALCKRRGAQLRIAPLDAAGALDLDAFYGAINDRTRLIAVAHVSNVLGTRNPVKLLAAEAHRRDIPIVIDGAQAAGHMAVDVQDLDCDFYCFSGHKMYAPMGIGVLYGKEKWLERMPPYQSGGGIVVDVAYDRITTLKGLPDKFEAGTPNVGGAVALGAAIEYLGQIGLEAIQQHERELLAYATERLQAIENLTVVGQAPDRSGMVSFLLDGIHPYDVGNLANAHGIALRTGVHCAIPLVDRLSLPVGTVRASFGIYNTLEEVDLLEGVLRAVKPDFWTLQKPNQRR